MCLAELAFNISMCEQRRFGWSDAVLCLIASFVSNTQTMHSEKRSGPREGGSRAMEEIRKQRLVRGIAGALRGYV